MRKVFHLLFICIFLFSIRGLSQTITDTGVLRTSINTQIVPNGQREISANQLNRILNGLMNTLTPYGVDSLSYDSVTNRIFGYRYSGFPTIILQLKRVYNSGTVTSVGLTMPQGFTVSSSPITSNGTFTILDTLSNGVVHSSSGAFVSGQIINTDVHDVAWTKITGAPTFLTLSSISATPPLLYNNSTGVFSIQQGTSSQNGYISSTDFINFNAKQNPITWQNVTATSSKITLSGTPVGSVNSAFGIDVNEANLTLSNMGGVLPITKGGTNATTASAALNNLFPSQTGKANYSAVSDGTNINWVLISGGSGSGILKIFGTNGLINANDSSLKQGGRFTQSTIFSGQNLYSLLYDSITTFRLNGKFQTNQKAYYISHPTFATADSLAFVDYETLTDALSNVPIAFSQLTDVNFTTLANNQVPTYNFSTSNWVNTALTTSIVAEGSNLYFTNAKAQNAVGLGTAGQLTYWATNNTLYKAPIIYDSTNNQFTTTKSLSINQSSNTSDITSVATTNSIYGHRITGSSITSVYFPFFGAVSDPGAVTAIITNPSTDTSTSSRKSSVGLTLGTAMGYGDNFILLDNHWNQFIMGQTVRFGGASKWMVAKGSDYSFSNSSPLLTIDTLGRITLPMSPLTGTSSDSVLVRISGTGDIKMISQSTIANNAGGNASITTALSTTNFTFSGITDYVILPDLTGQANRTVTLPVSPIVGHTYFIENNNASSFTWSFVGSNVKDFSGTTVTTISNQTNYMLKYNGTFYKIFN